MELNQPLATAYYLKDDLRQIWMQPNKRTARRVLRDWLKRARASKIRMLEQFADTLEEHQEGILNYYTCRISTGPLEGTNTKIQLMKRQAYGFRDYAFFKLKILGIHETKHALVGYFVRMRTVQAWPEGQIMAAIFLRHNSAGRGRRK